MPLCSETTTREEKNKTKQKPQSDVFTKRRGAINRACIRLYGLCLWGKIGW